MDLVRTFASSICGFIRTPKCQADEPVSTIPRPGITSGILQVSHGGPVLTEPSDSSEQEVLRYGLGVVFQVAPRTAAVMCNVRSVGEGHWDWENGTDVVVFDDLTTIAQQRRIPVARNKRDQNPSTGQNRVAVTYPIYVGFVPQGAKRPDGTAHPEAGTGFGFSQVLYFDLNDQGYYTTVDAKTDGQVPSNMPCYVYQFAYHDDQFHIVKEELRPTSAPLKVANSPWAIIDPGFSTATPDGDDLLFAAVAYDGTKEAAGVSRWRRTQGEWRPVEFSVVDETRSLVTGSQRAYRSRDCEPSLIRDVDGSWLYSVRSLAPEEAHAVRVWRSRDDPRSWEPVIYIPNLRANAHVVLNQAADGTPYLAVNHPDSFRAKLCICPLNAQRTGCEATIIARDCMAEFGPPPPGSLWFADQPMATTVRLADGQWKNLLSYRVMAFNTSGVGQEANTPRTGWHLEQVFSSGPARPAWKF